MSIDLKTLQGTWHIRSLEVDGAAMGAASLGGATISVTGDRFTTSSMGAEYSGRFDLDDQRRPKTLAMHFNSGPESGSTNFGIYELDNDRWRLCLNMSGGPAPAEFKTAPGSGYALETLARAESKPPAAIDPSTREPVSELQGEWAMVSCIRVGEPLPAGFARNGKRTIAGVQSTLHFGNQMFMQGLLSKDLGGPNAVKLEHTGGDAQGTTQLGIYELAGDGLKTCFGAAGRERPTHFASSTDGGETFAVWKRLKARTG